MREGETQKICNIIDDVTNLRYKIIYRRSKDRYEIWTQFYDANGKLHRKRISFEDALAVEKNLEKTIGYVNESLVAKHINIYERLQSATKRPRSSNKTRVNRDTTMLDTITNKEISNCKTLEQLFCIWQKEQSSESDDSWNLTRGSAKNITKAHFRRDGIIDNEVFSKETCKILFISSEANDDEYSAKTNATPNTVDDYIMYHKTRYDDWGGKMRERLAEIYKVLNHIERSSLANPDAVLHFAVMDINKRGGRSTVDDDHVANYCHVYASFIRKEIEIINPDVVAIVGSKLYETVSREANLGIIKEEDKAFFDINDKLVPILNLWHTCYTRSKIEPAKGYDDKTIGRQVAKVMKEMEKYNLEIDI